MISVEDLTVFYENMVALNDVSLRAERGQLVGVFGSNSAGKSTLLHAVSGILLDLARKERMRGGERITLLGRIRYDGEGIEGLEPSERARRGIVLCPERRRLFAESSVEENLRIGGWLASRAEARATRDFVLDLFPPLRDLLGRPAGFLSGGEQQMVAVGRALMAQPRLLLLDEPLLGLAPVIQQRLIDAIVAIRDARAVTIVVAEQYARPVLPVVDHAWILENGSVVLDGTRDTLLGNPDVKAAYFGT